MDDLLASIRRIIAEDLGDGPTVPGERGGAPRRAHGPGGTLDRRKEPANAPHALRPDGKGQPGASQVGAGRSFPLPSSKAAPDRAEPLLAAPPERPPVAVPRPFVNKTVNGPVGAAATRPPCGPMAAKRSAYHAASAALRREDEPVPVGNPEALIEPVERSLERPDRFERPDRGDDPDASQPGARANGASARDPDAPSDPLALSGATLASLAASIDTLSSAFEENRRQSVDELVRELMQPLLREWLDVHLPGIVEREVEAAIERYCGAPSLRARGR